MKRTLPLLAVLLLSLPAHAARNTSGTYTLPSGNPVVSGTTITSTWANGTMSDLKVEITNSLSRDGFGAMRAALKVPSGSAAAPTYSFTSDATSGLYLASSGETRMCVASTDIMKWTASTTTVLNAGVFARGLTVTQSDDDQVAIIATGNGEGSGVRATGGTSQGSGIEATGGATTGTGGVGVVGTGGTGTVTGGTGGLFTGTGTGGFGVVAIGGTGTAAGSFQGGSGTSPGLTATAGSGGTGVGVVATGGSDGGIGLQVAAGVASSAGTPKTALSITNGNLSLGSTANPNATLAFSNTLTPANIPKAWAKLRSTTSTSVTTLAGFNVASAAVAGDFLTMTLATAVASECMAVVSIGDGSTPMACRASCVGTSVQVQCVDVSQNSTPFGTYNFQTATGRSVNVLVFGAQ